MIVCVIFIMLCLLYAIYVSTFPKRIDEPKGLLKLKIKPCLYDDTPQKELVFEKQDITYYTEQPTFVLNYNDFDLQELTVEIPEIDTQNVHDTFVQKSTRKSFSEINSKDSSSEEIQDTIREMIIESKSYDDSETIEKVITNIQKRNSNITNLESTELQVLCSVWEAAKKDQCIKDYLMIQIKDCVSEYSGIVCPTGVVTRLTSTLFINDPSKFPKTKEIINQEMLGSAAKLRADLEKTGEYTSQEFSCQLQSKLEEDYQSILSPEEITDMTREWIHHL